MESAEAAASGSKVDAVAVALLELAGTRQDTAWLLKVFSCPVLAYGLGTSPGGWKVLTAKPVTR